MNDKDVISRRGVSAWLDNMGYPKLADTIMDEQRFPSAQPERKKGKWINHRKDNGHNIADCDRCGNAIQWFDGDEIPRYCCMCGADMRGEQDDQI